MMAGSGAPNQSNSQTDRLLEISRVLTSTLELRPLLDSIVEIACELTNSEAASILLYDEKSDELKFQAAPGRQAADLKDLKVPLDASVAGWIFNNALPLVIQDAEADTRVYREVDRSLGFNTRSILGVPLVVQQRPTGVIEVVNKRGDDPFSEDDLAVLETLASQAAIAIENARLLGKLRDANIELQRLDGMKSDFIAIASHELRTPLGLILGHATFIKDLVPEDYQEQMDVIIRAAIRLKEIIEDMSAIAHSEQGMSRVRRKGFSVSQLIDEVIGRFMDEAHEKEIDLTEDIPTDQDLVVVGDRDKIDLALTNLVRNAIAFTDSGGQVGVKAELGGGYVQVFVVDTGIGIPETETERVFERFYQVESHLTRKHGGMGLGLSIAKAMVEMHNGQIWCESKPGVGSLFCFQLPASTEKIDPASKVFTTA
jgi:signal transduction histidine kinase